MNSTAANQPKTSSRNWVLFEKIYLKCTVTFDGNHKSFVVAIVLVVIFSCGGVFIVFVVVVINSQQSTKTPMIAF